MYRNHVSASVGQEASQPQPSQCWKPYIPILSAFLSKGKCRWNKGSKTVLTDKDRNGKQEAESLGMVG